MIERPIVIVSFDSFIQVKLLISVEMGMITFWSIWLDNDFYGWEIYEGNDILPTHLCDCETMTLFKA